MRNKPPRRSASTLILTFVVIASCICALPSAAQPLVLVDQSHWNLLSLSPTEMWNMSSLAQELTDNGYAVEALEVPLSSAALGPCCVYIIPTPSLDYSDAELAALQAFADQGGGVLFTANYGTNPNTGNPTSWADECQKVANALGFNLDNNIASDPTHNLYFYPYWIRFNGSRMGSHPVMNGLDSVQCFSTTTLTGPAGAVALLTTYPSSTPAASPAGAAADYGSGRAIALGNCMYMADVVPDRVVNGELVDMTGITEPDNRRFMYQAITYLAGAQGRPLVSISSPAALQTVYGVVDIRGTACDAYLTNFVVEYAEASDPSTYHPIATVNQSRVMESLAQWDTSAVSEGDCNIRVTAHSSPGTEFSRSVDVHVIHPAQPATAAECKAYPDGTLVALTGKTASTGSGDFDGFFYLQEPDRTSAIRVASDGFTVNRGDIISLVGTLSTTDGERCITPIELTVN